MPNIHEINELLRLDDDALVDTTEAAAVVGLMPETLRWYRTHSPERAPRHTIVGLRAVRYRMGELRTYIAARGT